MLPADWLCCIMPLTKSDYVFLTDAVLHAVKAIMWLLQARAWVPVGVWHHANTLRSSVVPHALCFSLPNRLCGASDGLVILFFWHTALCLSYSALIVVILYLNYKVCLHDRRLELCYRCFISRLSMIIRVNVVLNRCVNVIGAFRFA